MSSSSSHTSVWFLASKRLNLGVFWKKPRHQLEFEHITISYFVPCWQFELIRDVKWASNPRKRRRRSHRYLTSAWPRLSATEDTPSSSEVSLESHKKLNLIFIFLIKQLLQTNFRSRPHHSWMNDLTVSAVIGGPALLCGRECDIKYLSVNRTHTQFLNYWMCNLWHRLHREPW